MYAQIYTSKYNILAASKILNLKIFTIKTEIKNTDMITPDEKNLSFYNLFELFFLRSVCGDGIFTENLTKRILGLLRRKKIVFEDCNHCLIVKNLIDVQNLQVEIHKYMNEMYYVSALRNSGYIDLYVYDLNFILASLVMAIKQYFNIEKANLIDSGLKEHGNI